jgi:hypothetical protein
MSGNGGTRPGTAGTGAQGPLWVASRVCADCLASDLGRAIISGVVGLATTDDSLVERCVLCGFPLQTEGNARGP